MPYPFVVGGRPPRLYQPEEFDIASLARRGLESPSGEELLHNSLGFGFVAVTFFLWRITNRLFILHKFKLDDLVMVLSMIGYGALLVLINYSVDYSPNFYRVSMAEGILTDPMPIADRVNGSKLVGIEQAMFVTTWTVRICIWLFLHKSCRLIKAYGIYMWLLLVYIATGFIVTEALYFFVFCLPFPMYWTIPVTNPQCAAHTYHSIAQAIFNISTGLLLMAGPLKMIWGKRLTLNRKLLVLVPFCFCGFIFVAVALNLYYKLTSPHMSRYKLWYIREASDSLCLANLLCTWPLWQVLFRLQDFDTTSLNSCHNSTFLDIESTNNQLSWNQRLRRFLGLGNPPERVRGTRLTSFEDGIPNLLIVSGAGYDEQAARSARKGNFRNNTNFTLMSLKRDGDDASHSIADRDQEGIV
ncbi:hypothetical protein BJ875DRAFT_474930 [Amylocarpus encephaloides]|uniref:Rhodopsin domain-containing protein n=1 Tax=Amylocarpus encephaloides TaxID=45428 RepID=A0A9P7Y931_9HELO|nr:hypothetical protein BJ875DRAFT_474930 [Amylocarpus encephaloides]